MDARSLAFRSALGRTVVGTALAVAPRLAGPAWLGRGVDTPGARVMTTAMGARDAAIGLGALRALRAGRGAAPWLLAGAAADAADAIATIRAREQLPPVAVAVAAFAVGSAALGAWLARAAS